MHGFHALQFKSILLHVHLYIEFQNALKRVKLHFLVQAFAPQSDA
jgi:hypothetical protein